MQLLQWYNLIFFAPIALAAIYLVLSATGLGSDSGDGGDAEVDVDMDMDADFDADVDMDVDADLGAGVDMDANADLDHHVEAPHGMENVFHDGHKVLHDQPLMLRALSVLGFGRVPLSIILTCLMVIFGAVGLISNGLFAAVLPWGWAPTIYVWPSLGIASLAAITLTGSVARTLQRYLPTSETYAITPEELVGRLGVAVYSVQPGSPGVVSVRAEGGTVYTVSAHTAEESIPSGTEVILVRYHGDGDYYDVSPSPV